VEEHIMALHVGVHPRFGGTARVTTEASGRPQLVADSGTGGTLSVQVDDELGGVELAAQFTRELAANTTAALRFAQRCAELMPGPAVVVPAQASSGPGVIRAVGMTAPGATTSTSRMVPASRRRCPGRR
jgi:hypothetical protein